MKQLLKVSISDFKMIFRAPSLRIFFALPIMILLVTNVFLPWLIGKFPLVEDYAIYVVVLATIEVTQMFGFIYSMVLIEEKEQEVSKVYGIMPISRIAFSLSRLLISVLITIVLTALILQIQPFYEISILQSLLFGAMAGLVVPAYVLSVALMSKNKMEGMVWIKVVNIAVVLPTVAFFVPQGFTWLFGILPTHWAFQGLYQLFIGQGFVLHLVIGTVFFIILISLLVQRFAKNHFA